MKSAHFAHKKGPNGPGAALMCGFRGEIYADRLSIGLGPTESTPERRLSERTMVAER